jgi:hypothetical protein
MYRVRLMANRQCAHQARICNGKSALCWNLDATPKFPQNPSHARLSVRVDFRYASHAERTKHRRPADARSTWQVRFTPSGFWTPPPDELWSPSKKLATSPCLDLARGHGEVHRWLKRGALTIEDIHGELGDVLAGSVPGRRSTEEITIAKFVGIGVQFGGRRSIHPQPEAISF